MSGNNKKTKGVLRNFVMFLNRNRLGEILVLKGFITPSQLKFALQAQKKTHVPLGQILIIHNLISRRQLAFVLVRQAALRCLTTLVLTCVSLVNFSGKKAQAYIIKAVPAQESIASAETENHLNLVSYPKLFGTSEIRSANLREFTKWSGMLKSYERQMQSSSAQDVMQEWRDNIEFFRGLPLKVMASRVNDMMNKKSFIPDRKNWGQSDYWETPVEFMRRGGDCEDFAIAKYASLRALGVPEERLRVAVVQDTYKNIPHAVLIVYTDEGIYALDNQTKPLIDATVMKRYRPIFSINREGWWLHSTPDSAQVTLSTASSPSSGSVLASS